MHNIYYVGKQRGCRHIHKCTSSCNAINILMCFSDLHSTAAILSSFLFSSKMLYSFEQVIYYQQFNIDIMYF